MKPEIDAVGIDQFRFNYPSNSESYRIPVLKLNTLPRKVALSKSRTSSASWESANSRRLVSISYTRKQGFNNNMLNSPLLG